MKRKTLIWSGIFLFIFLLTQATYLTSFSANPMMLGLPSWIWYFIGLHLVFVVVLYFFSEQFFKNEGE